MHVKEIKWLINFNPELYWLKTIPSFANTQQMLLLSILECTTEFQDMSSLITIALHPQTMVVQWPDMCPWWEIKWMTLEITPRNWLQYHRCNALLHVYDFLWCIVWFNFTVCYE